MKTLQSNNKKYRVMTAIINQGKGDFFSPIQFTDDAKSITPNSSEWAKFFGYYPCLFQNGKEIARLDPDCFSKFANGDEADIYSGNSGDVMIAFPRRGIKIVTRDKKTFISVTDEPDNPNFTYYAHQRGNKQREVFYTGVYKGYVKNGKLRSLSGKFPTSNASITNFRKYAHKNGKGYEIGTFYQHMFQQIIFIFSYGTFDSFKNIGQGRHYVFLTDTGSTDNFGMDCKSDSLENSIKLFGIEDFYGGLYEFIDGLQINGNRALITSTGDFNDYGYKYRFCDGAPFGGRALSIQGNSELGFFPRETGLKYDSDVNFSYPFENNIPYIGLNADFDWDSGPFSITMAQNHLYKSFRIGARLSYI